MSHEPVSYSVLLLPRREVAARHLTLREAEAWIRTYNAILHGEPSAATIIEEPQEMTSERHAA